MVSGLPHSTLCTTFQAFGVSQYITRVTRDMVSGLPICTLHITSFFFFFFFKAPESNPSRNAIQLTRNDLTNVCRVCRLFNASATPFLYRSLIFRDSPIDENHCSSRIPDDDEVTTEVEDDDLSFALLYRLLNDSNDILRRFVREITFERMDNRNVQQLNDALATLVNKLPNLEVIQ